jgi:hypothetical protein
MRALRTAAALVLVAGSAIGCTTSGGGGAAGASSSPSAAAPVTAAQAPAPSLPACANAGPAVPIPAAFPPAFALPDGSVVVGTDTPAGGGSRITAIVPLEVDEFGEFLERALPAAGLAIGGGEAEADELESKFSGAGVAGQVTARELSGCPGILSVQVAIRAS